VTTRQKLELYLLTGAVAISRFAFRSHDLYDIDSVNFALGMERFDPACIASPARLLSLRLPGPAGQYPVHDANLALVILSILASMASVILIYRLAWTGSGLARLPSPACSSCFRLWHGSTAPLRSPIALSRCIGTGGSLCWRIDRGKTSLILPTAIVLGSQQGFGRRPFSFLARCFFSRYGMRQLGRFCWG